VVRNWRKEDEKRSNHRLDAFENGIGFRKVAGFLLGINLFSIDANLKDASARRNELE